MSNRGSISRHGGIEAWKYRGAEVPRRGSIEVIARSALSRARARAGVADVSEVQGRLLSANVSRRSVVDLGT
jgi:hypothetical protein